MSPSTGRDTCSKRTGTHIDTTRPSSLLLSRALTHPVDIWLRSVTLCRILNSQQQPRCLHHLTREATSSRKLGLAQLRVFSVDGKQFHRQNKILMGVIISSFIWYDMYHIVILLFAGIFIGGSESVEKRQHLYLWVTTVPWNLPVSILGLACEPQAARRKSCSWSFP